jgi:NAD(P)H-dependent FMN reductase
MDHIPAGLDFDLELVDLIDWPLPNDEPDIPAAGLEYENAHTRAWSRKVSEAAGFVFVTPQYNWGYPAPLKNALDHLYREWTGKPAIIVSYGFHGGGRCAAQLRQVLEGLRMRPTPTMPALTLPEEMKAKDAPVDRALQAFAGSVPDVEAAFTELQKLLEAAQ